MRRATDAKRSTPTAERASRVRSKVPQGSQSAAGLLHAILLITDGYKYYKWFHFIHGRPFGGGASLLRGRLDYSLFVQ
jgi:hypothetical protein